MYCGLGPTVSDFSCGSRDIELKCRYACSHVGRTSAHQAYCALAQQVMWGYMYPNIACSPEVMREFTQLCFPLELSWNAFSEAADRVAQFTAAAAARHATHTLRQSQGVDPRLTDRTYSGQLLFTFTFITFTFVTGALHAGVHKVGTTRPDAARAIAERTKERATAFARAVRGWQQPVNEVLHENVTIRRRKSAVIKNVLTTRWPGLHRFSAWRV